MWGRNWIGQGGGTVGGFWCGVVRWALFPARLPQPLNVASAARLI